MKQKRRIFFYNVHFQRQGREGLTRLFYVSKWRTQFSSSHFVHTAQKAKSVSLMPILLLHTFVKKAGKILNKTQQASCKSDSVEYRRCAHNLCVRVCVRVRVCACMRERKLLLMVSWKKESQRKKLLLSSTLEREREGWKVAWEHLGLSQGSSTRIPRT